MVGAVLGEMRITMADDAKGGGGCTMGVRQHLLNENDGDMCVCGTWDQYGNYNGGWAAVDLQDPAHGCQQLSIHQPTTAASACTAVMSQISHVTTGAGWCLHSTYTYTHRAAT